VFGEVIKGKGVVKKVELVSTDGGDKPRSPCVITACGQLQPDDPSLKPPTGASGSVDVYEEFPEDEDNVDISQPEVALQAAEVILEAGKQLWKEGEFQDAFDKWQKGIRYLEHHPEFSTYPPGKAPVSEGPDAPKNEQELKTRQEFQRVLSVLSLNSTLAALKLPGRIGPKALIDLANKAVKFAFSDDTRAKGLYRRGLVHVALKQEEKAEIDLVEATKLVNDPGIVLALERVRATLKANAEREKNKYRKFFA